jgi:hypothetical protein
MNYKMIMNNSYASKKKKIISQELLDHQEHEKTLSHKIVQYIQDHDINLYLRSNETRGSRQGCFI